MRRACAKIRAPAADRRKVSRYVLGIDLGTVNSCVAVVQDGKAVVIQDGNDNRIPSCMALQRGKEVIGHAARRQAVTDPHNTISAVKRILGHPYESREVQTARERVAYPIRPSPLGDVLLEIGGKELTPIQVSARILARVKEVAENALGTSVSQAVISVPAHFTDVQRKATKQAAEYAGLEVLRLINEPTAAAFAYGYKKGGTFTLAVYDLGGGTFDITVMQAKGDTLKVLATDGDSYLGGEDFDHCVQRWLIDEFRAEFGHDLSDDKSAVLRLREAAEKAKIELSSNEQTQIDLPFLAQLEDGSRPNFARSLDRAKFRELTEPIVRQTLDLCERCLQTAGLPRNAVGEVLLVGGQSRTHSVREAVQLFFGRAPRRDINPDEVVAMGAALYAYSLAADELAATARSSAEDDYAVAVKQTAIAEKILTDVQRKLDRTTLQSDGLRSRLASLLADLGPSDEDEEPTNLRVTAPKLSGTAPREATAQPRSLAAPPAAKSKPAEAASPAPAAKGKSAAKSTPPPDSKGAKPKGPAPKQADPTQVHPKPAAAKQTPKQKAKPQSEPAESESDAMPGLEISPSLQKSSIELGDDPGGPMEGLEVSPSHATQPSSTQSATTKSGEADSEPSLADFADADPGGLDIDSHVQEMLAGSQAPGGAPDAGQRSQLETQIRPPASASAARSQLETRFAEEAELPAPGNLPTALGDVQAKLSSMGGIAQDVLDALAEEIAGEKESDELADEAADLSRALAQTVSAAAQAAERAKTHLHEAEQHANARRVKLIDVTSHALGIGSAGDLMTVVIEHNTSIPVENLRVFTTNQDGQTEVSIRVFQGRHKRASENQMLGDFILDGIPPARRMEPKIGVTFRIDENGILSVSAQDNESGTRQHIRIEDPLGLQQVESNEDGSEA